MVFEEKDYLDLTNTPTTFIYFLLRDDEVVYVGQTQRGLSRVYAHRDKDFNKVYAIEVDASKLDYMEDMYIKKYCPKYNKVLNLRANYSFSKAVHEINTLYINNTFKGNGCNKHKLKKIIKALDIKPFEYNGVLYLDENDFNLICDTIEAFLMGENDNEVFDIWV